MGELGAGGLLQCLLVDFSCLISKCLIFFIGAGGDVTEFCSARYAHSIADSGNREAAILQSISYYKSRSGCAAGDLKGRLQDCQRNPYLVSVQHVLHL